MSDSAGHPVQNGPTRTAPIPIPGRSAEPSSHDGCELASTVIFDRERLFPKSVAAHCGLDHETMAMLEVPNGSSSLYNALLQYASHYAVDINTDLSTLTSESEALTEAESASNDIKFSTPNDVKHFTSNDDKRSSKNDSEVESNYKGYKGVTIPGREGPGELSNLWNCPVDRFDPFNSDSETDPDSDSDCSQEFVDFEDEDDDQDPVEVKKKKDAILESYISIGSLKKKVEPPVQRYQLGIGFAKLPLNGYVVYLHHWGYGLPVPKSYSVEVFRSLVLAGDHSKDLKELCAVALKWRSDREQSKAKPRPGRFILYRFKTTGGGCGDWSNQGYKRSRSPKSVILPEGQLETIVRDLKDFVGKDTKLWYESHGLPYRRSYLFHGPPGCGKSSTIRMIAGLFRLNACFLSLTANDFSNQVLQDGLASLPRRALLVMEDVDVLFNEDRKSETASALTFSGMLNALDGLVSADGVVTIFTTNHIEKLDAALIRGGRVDRRFEFVHPSHKQMCALFLSFYEDASREVAERFADAVLNRPEEEARSIATLQQHFIYTRKMSAETSVKMLPKFFNDFYPKGVRARNPLYL